MKKILLVILMVILLFLGSVNYNLSQAHQDCPVDKDESTIISKMEKIKCVDIKKEYPYEGDSTFTIENTGSENLCITIALRIFKNGRWEMFSPNMAPFFGAKVGDFFIRPNEKIDVTWYKNRKKGLEKGARMMIYTWKKSPLSHGIIKNLCEFQLLPKKKVKDRKGSTEKTVNNSLLNKKSEQGNRNGADSGR